ncbi:MAG TPA: Gfo/Idh/MocA family protein [Candidatus Wujingus californicus]|uniref:Gfo/Idh/MocA family protein n=1 Tax=Candidatus Wujingus californicus TaxID=3367618 RepID=UPI004028A605
MKVKIGIIGYKNHALRLIKLVSQNEHSTIKFIYHPQKRIDHSCATNRLEDLYQCDAVIISSPNYTHFDYIMNLLKYFKGYIFCEKPPVVRLTDVESLSSISRSDKSRVFFNYNYRFGFLNKILSDSYYLEKLGIIHYINIICDHGLAFKEDYINSWRADGKDNLHAIMETVVIHYIDLLRLHFGQIINYVYKPYNVANTGTAYDTVYTMLSFNKITASIYASYASPYINKIFIIGTKGFLEILEGQISLYYPRDTFNSNGFFKSPPLNRKIVMNNQKEYEDSLKKSLEFFICHVLEGKKIDTKYFEASLSSNKFLLEIRGSESKKINSEDYNYNLSKT